MNVGNYVRTNYGISKCIKIIPIRENSFMYEYDKEVYEDVNYLTASELEKYKSSPNIIDLIEIGDYVNGSKVVDISIIGKDKEKWVWVEQMEDTDNKYGDDYVGYNNEQIKSIVTKEQFESMKYEIK